MALESHATVFLREGAGTDRLPPPHEPVEGDGPHGPYGPGGRDGPGGEAQDASQGRHNRPVWPSSNFPGLLSALALCPFFVGAVPIPFSIFNFPFVVQFFIPVRVTPSMKYRWAKKNSPTTGRTMMVEAAMSMPKSPPYSARRSNRPSASGYNR